MPPGRPGLAMIEFDLTDEQRLIQETPEDFANRETIPPIRVGAWQSDHAARGHGRRPTVVGRALTSVDAMT